MVASSFLALVLSIMWSQSNGWGQECWDSASGWRPCSDIWTISTTADSADTADTSTSYDESSMLQNPVPWIIAVTLLLGILFICWASAQPKLIRVEESQVAAEARVPGKAAC